jgi:uncharacterized heparinase superfamily protein
MDVAYARALLQVAPLSAIARAAVRRSVEKLIGHAPSPGVDAEVVRLAADALGRAPRFFTDAPLDEPMRRLFPASAIELHARANRILDGEVMLFGRAAKLSARIDWSRDPFTGEKARDPKLPWELARFGHLVELGAAARIFPELAVRARAQVASQIDNFLADASGDELHTAPLEVAVRAIHWLAAIELCGGASVFPRAFVERLGPALWRKALFLRANLENRGVIAANHLLGELVGLWTIAVALDGAPAMRRLATWAAPRLVAEAARQVESDGAHFEASTGYHRFALELLMAALFVSRSSERGLAIGEVVHRMLGWSRATLAPDGNAPGFGDGDDARVLPLFPRGPREQAHLLAIGACLFGDPELRRHGARPSEEALFLLGPEAAKTWEWVPPSTDAVAFHSPRGGVHVLRGGGFYAAMRAGSYGQRGVGGHAHNDQLALVLYAGARPIVIDPGTASYTGDRLARDRFRGTAAHATVLIGGAEQSPILETRPFALPDRAHGRVVELEELGSIARLTAEHRGYRRLPNRVVHRRRLTLHRDHGLLIVEDELDGRGEVSIELRFPLAVAPGPGAHLADRLGALAQLLPGARADRAVALGDVAALIPLGDLVPRIEDAAVSPQYAHLERAPLVSFAVRPSLPVLLRVAFLRYGET